MTQQKKNRIAAAVTVNVVVLLVVLVAVVIYQLAVIVRTAKQYEKLEQEYAKYEKQIDDLGIERDKLESMLNSDRELLYYMFENGYVFESDNN